jgi:D-glycero-D-manno-heptose 1,7-bisphosphate phosphatase
MRPAAFLDRDGTINEERIYLSNPADFQLLPGVALAIRRLNQAGWAVVVVTNQSGLARGYFTLDTLEQIHLRLKQDLAAVNAYVDAIYLCPHHPDAGCACRKPGVALFEQAARDLNLDLSQSVLIGDKPSDLQPGCHLGSRTVLVLTGHGQTEWQGQETWNFTPDVVVPALPQAVDWLFSSKSISLG